MEVLLTQEFEQIKEDNNFDLNNLTIPTTIKNKVLLSPGNWNGLDFSSDEIKKAFYNTDWTDKKNFELIKDHLQSVDSLVGYVRNIKLNSEGAIIGDLELWDEKMIKNLIVLKAKFGISARIVGLDIDGKFTNFTFNNFSIVDEPACEKTYINLAQIEKKEMSVFTGFINGYEFSESKDKKRMEELNQKKKELEEISKDNTYTIKREEIKMQEEKQKADIVNEAPEETKVEEVVEEAPKAEETKVEESAEETKEEVVEEAKESSKLSKILSAIKELSVRIEKLEEKDTEEESEEKSEDETIEEESELTKIKKEVAELKSKDNAPKSFSVQELKRIGALPERHSQGTLAISEILLRNIQ